MIAGWPLALIVLGLWQLRRAPLAEFETLSLVVSSAEIMVSAAALVLSLAGFVLFRRLGLEPLKSGSALADNFQKGSNFLTSLTAALGLSLPLSLILAVFYELQYHWLHLNSQSDLEFLFFFLGIMAVPALAIFAFKLTAAVYKNFDRRVAGPETLSVLGRRLTEAEVPRLWAVVRSISEKLETNPPDHIVLGLDGCFFATEAPVWLSPDDQKLEGRLLYLSLPGLTCLPLDEIRAVIGHELGHFAGGDAVHCLKSVQTGAVANLEALDAARGREDLWFGHLAALPIRMMGEYFLDSFHLAVSRWNRERETAADRAGASVAGNETLALALLRLAVLEPGIGQVPAEYRNDVKPGAEGFMPLMRRIIKERGLVNPADYLENSTPHPTDSHPPLRRRLSDLGIEPNSAFFERVRDTSAAFTALNFLGLDDEPDGEWLGLTAALGDMSARMAARREEMETILLQAAGLNGLERREFYEGVWKMAILLGGGIWLFGAATVWTFGSPQGLVCLAIVLLMIMLLIKLLFRRRRPFLIAAAEGFRAGRMEKEISWEAVRYFHLFHSHGIYTVIFVLEPDFRPPLFQKDGHCRYAPNEHAVRCSAVGLRRPVKRDDLDRILSGYLRGAKARAELRSRGLPLTPEPPQPG